MASLSRITKCRRRLKERKAGRKRKNQMAARSTLTYAELFAGCGEPGKPVSETLAPSGD